MGRGAEGDQWLEQSKGGESTEAAGPGHGAREVLSFSYPKVFGRRGCGLPAAPRGSSAGKV